MGRHSLHDFMLSLAAGLIWAVVLCAFVWLGHSFIALEYADPNTGFMRGLFIVLATYGTIASIGK